MRTDDMNPWYHGGQFEDGNPKGTYLYVTDKLQLAKAHALEKTNGKVYRLRSEYQDLVADHSDGKGRKVIFQEDLKKLGGALSVFVEDV